MFKNFQNQVMALPKGNPNPWVNLFWMLVFFPFLLVLGGFVLFVFYAVGRLVLESVFR
ncbi:MAG: hypothetical protein M5U25_15540 [Planctomycetota bacterium]|nr:hypothetical protein [Planctomycetota bacterium]